MATVVTIHGTFAHSGGTAEALQIGDGAEAQWWQPGSAFEADLRTMIAGADGRLDFVPFAWSAANSEIDRRKAGAALLKLLLGLEQKGEPYAVIGHSHGGSVIASALIESVARRRPLTHLKRWITVGTPFVGMRKERFLFTRLTLARKVIFVASFMLFMMFLFYAAAELWDGARRFWTERYITALLFSGTMMTLPIAFFYLVFRYLDHREHMGYSRAAIQKARDLYADKWLPLCHKDDEAVHGLRLLPNVKLNFFEDDFATSTLTKASIIALPLMYLLVVTSPPTMLAISDFLQTRVYGVEQFAAADESATRARDELTSLTRRMREAHREAERSGLDPGAAEEARRKASDFRRQLRERRRQLEQSFPQFAEVERAQRFKRRFLMRGRTPCEGGRLCGGGHDYALNSKLLFHVVTDELSSAVVNEDVFGGAVGGAVRLLAPIVLVPVAFAVIALGVLAIIQFLASIVSAVVSRILNTLTLSEVKRSSFGNDTEGEIVLGADYNPSWLDPVTCLLPAEVSDGISEHSNAIATQSLSKFRNAISTLAFSEGEDNRAGLVSSFLSWKELVHTCYFDVASFRKIVAQSISQAEGFQPTEAFRRDGDFDRTATWVAALGQKMEEDPHTGLLAGAVPKPITA